jgi:UDP-glucose 4,6-dehydratase
MKNILVTGGCGFIGSHFVNRLLQNKTLRVVNIDCLNYCSSTLNVNFTNENYVFVKGNVKNEELVYHVLKSYDIDTVVHFAAQSHVDNSFINSFVYTMDNVVGTHTLIECIRNTSSVTKFIHISTDEVYGDFGDHKKKENSVLCPTNPYAATKAAAELLVQSYYHSYGLPAMIIRSNNVYGPNQYLEKVIPKFITSIRNDEACTIHGTGENKRAFLYVSDIVDAVLLVLNRGVTGEIYNVGSEHEISVNELLEILRQKLCPDKSIDQIRTFVEDRPYNDKRYYVCDEKLKGLGWEQRVSFDDGLQKTISWYSEHGQEHWH